MIEGTKMPAPRPPAQIERWRAAAADPVNHAIVALGITQIIAWGTTLYALGVLGKPIANDTGWSQSTVYGGLTVGLLVAGAISIPVGRWLDRIGGRHVMSLGSAAAGASLALLSQASSPVSYLAAWALLGLAMRMTLYDAAFAALVQIAGARGRRAISMLTLFGGLASTIFWPIGAALEFAYGWRAALLVFSALNLLVCLPLHWFFLRPGQHATAGNTVAPASSTVAATPLDGAQRRSAMVLFSIVTSASAILYGAMAVHLVSVLAATGIDARLAVILASAKGVAQTLSRLVDLVFGRNLHPMMLGRVTLACLPLAFLALNFAPAGFAAAAVFVLFFGIANGLTTIVRGAVPLAIFGPDGYGAVLGRLATPVLVTNAIAPVLFAVLAENFGLPLCIMVLTAIAILASAAMEVMAHWYRRTQSPHRRSLY